jgi:5-methylthioadenosine/S-adenosylhomocysteine deaminase
LLEPVRNIVPNLVYAASGHEVTTVMVAGKVMALLDAMEAGRL